MAQPVWVTPPGSLGTIPEGIYYRIPLEAYDPDSSTVYYQLLAGSLPPGIQIDETGILIGVPNANAYVEGVPLAVGKSVTSKFAIRAYTKRTVDNVTVINRLADRTFSLTVAIQTIPEFTTAPGQIAEYFDGTMVTDLQINYTTPETSNPPVVKLIGGSLPPGLTISSTGLISGVISPAVVADGTGGYSADGENYDQYPFSFPSKASSLNYEFLLEVTDGQGADQKSYSIFVWARSSMTADNTYVTGDNTFITADTSPQHPPIILNPQGSIGSIRSDNFFAYQFNGLDFDNDQDRFVALTSLPPGLTLDPTSGWLYGYIPNLGITENVYNFSIKIEKVNDTTIKTGPYNYSLTISGPISNEITWLTPSNLGKIDNGSTSLFYVKAVNSGGLALQYRLLSGSDSSLPQGLQLLSSGDIAGRVSFDTFALDGDTTTFDSTPQNGNKPTTFDMTYTFTVQAYSINGVVNVNKTFSITVVRAYNTPYENLYIQAMPPEDDRALLASLLQNSDIFNPAYLYRPDDPNFGVAKKVIYQHAFGLNPSTIAEYYSALVRNHYWKNLVLGEIGTAQATDSSGNVIYEVVYSKVVDNLVNNQGVSVSKEVVLPYPVNGLSTTDVVFPNSLQDMRQQVIDVVGQVSNILPLWMISKQANGQVLGFTPAWVLAYTIPGKSAEIAYFIQQQFANQLNLIDFDVDRYELDRALTKNWNPQTISSNIVSATGNGVVSTITFESQPAFSFNLGDPVKISGVIPDSFNGTFYITDSGSTQVKFYNNANTSGVGGIVSTVPNWVPHPPSLTTFDQNTTVFDGNSLQFIAPVDTYNDSNGQGFDKYLVFSKRNILQ